MFGNNASAPLKLPCQCLVTWFPAPGVGGVVSQVFVLPPASAAVPLPIYARASTWIEYAYLFSILLWVLYFRLLLMDNIGKVVDHLVQ